MFGNLARGSGAGRRRRLSLLAALLLAACGSPERALEPAAVVEEVSPSSPPDGVPAGGDGWSSVVVGVNHSCALTREGEAFCWGDARAAQVGVPEATDICGPPAAPCARRPVRVATAVRFTRLAAGGSHTCGLDASGAAWCWGSNAYGQLGLASPRLAYEPLAVQGNHRFADIAAGEFHTCGVRADGVALCWGRNENGELGRGTFGAGALPIAVVNLPAIVELSAGSARTCGATAAGVAWCWGKVWLYTSGGLEWSERRASPVRVPGAVEFASLSVGSLSTCGVAGDGIAHCWEANGFGQLGIGFLGGTAEPEAVASGERFLVVSAGSIQSCALAEDRRAWCWGNNSFGQLGDYTVRTPCAPTGLACAPVPNRVPGALRFVSLATGLGNHACGVTTLTNLYCWGLGASGQLGDGDDRTVIRRAPTRVAPRDDAS